MSNNNDLLAAMDIDVWVPRDRDAEQCASADAPDLASLKVAVSSCTRCELHTHRTQTVFGTGDPNASWLIVGEAPGAEEDRRGESSGSTRAAARPRSTETSSEQPPP